jgi:predicted GNAT superfamily acetyltransferase
VLDIRLARSAQDAALISRLFDQIWSVNGMVSPEIITATLHNGGYGSVAWLGDRPVGAAFALVGVPLEGEHGLNLHSHAAGVLADVNSRDYGTSIKHHQWRWARDNGFATCTWTFDPLVRRNAWFNIVKLGVAVLGYHVNFYGELDDGINAGEQSDRVLVRWQIEGLDVPPVGATIQARVDDEVIPTPADIESLRKTNKAESSKWREMQRGQFVSAKDMTVVGLTRDFEYVLRGCGR